MLIIMTLSADNEAAAKYGSLYFFESVLPEGKRIQSRSNLRITFINASPYRSSFFSPTLLSERNSPSVCGLTRHISSSAVSEKMTNGGTPRFRANSVLTALSASNSSRLTPSVRGFSERVLIFRDLLIFSFSVPRRTG